MLETGRNMGIYNSSQNYIYSFVYNENFGGKRFSRYLQKVKSEVEDFICRISCNDDVNFIDWVIEMIYRYYQDDQKQEAIDKFEHNTTGHYYDIIRNRAYEFESVDVKEFLLDPYKKYGNKSIEDMINEEFANACKLHIARQCTMHQEITEDNYNITLPRVSDRKYAEIWDIISNTINWSMRDIRNLAVDIKAEEMSVSAMRNKYVARLLDDLEEFEEKIATLEKENETLQQQVSVLKSKLNTKPDALEDLVKPYKDANEELRRRLASLQKKYDALEEKCQKEYKQEEVVNTASVPSEEVVETLDIDTEARYVFLVDPALPVAQRLLEEFPNCIVTKSNDNIDAKTTDFVVALTKSMRHDVYHGMRTQCKNKNIPFLHCHKTNVEFIKNTIGKYKKE